MTAEKPKGAVSPWPLTRMRPRRSTTIDSPPSRSDAGHLVDDAVAGEAGVGRAVGVVAGDGDEGVEGGEAFDDVAGGDDLAVRLRARSKVAPARPLGNRSLNGVRATPSPSRPKVRSGEPSELSRATAQPPSKESFATLPAGRFPVGLEDGVVRAEVAGATVTPSPPPKVASMVPSALRRQTPPPPEATILPLGARSRSLGWMNGSPSGSGSRTAAFAEGGVEGAVGVEPADPVAGARVVGMC